MKSYEPSHDFDTRCVLHAKFVFTIESREREREKLELRKFRNLMRFLWTCIFRIFLNEEKKVS